MIENVNILLKQLKEFLTFSYKNKEGFTLLELVVVFSIIGILSTIGVASFVDYSRSQDVQSAAFDLVTTIQLAKSRSISQVKPPQCDGQVLEGYMVSLLFSESKYQLDVVCSGNMYKINESFLADVISFDEAQTTTSSIFFPILKGGVVGDGEVFITGHDRTRCVLIDSSGGIQLPCPVSSPSSTVSPTPSPITMILDLEKLFFRNEITF